MGFVLAPGGGEERVFVGKVIECSGKLLGSVLSNWKRYRN